MLRQLIPTSAALLALVASSCAPAFVAPPHLVAAWPTAGATLAVAPHTFDLTFNRPLKAELTTASVWRDYDGAPLPSEVHLDPVDSRRLEVHLLEPVEGSYLVHWHSVAAASGDAADGEYAFKLRYESPSPPRMDLSPTAADKNEAVQVVGKGFATNSDVQLSIGDDKQPLGSVRTDGRGKFNVEVHVPASVPLGIQPVSAVDGEGRTATVAIQTRWGGWPPVVATNLAQPGPGRGEVTFTLNVRNLSDYVLEHVRVVMRDPDGGTLVGADPAPQRDAGTLVWIIPTMDRGTVGPFRATYRTSTASVSHAWLEFRHRHTSACARDDCLPAFISESTADSLAVSPAD